MTDVSSHDESYVLAGWLLIAAWSAAGLVAFLVPAAAGQGFVFQTLLAFAFALVHGAVRYGWKGILVFAVLVIVTANIFENLSIETGFPFGLFHHNGEPKLFNFPWLSMPGYFGLAYLSWIVAVLLLGEPDSNPSWLSFTTVAVAATFIVTGYDASVDPIYATIAQAWVYAQGGGYFGVPLSNTLGWLLVSFIFFLSFAIFLYRKPQLIRAGQGMSWWAQPAVMLGLAALRQPLNLLNPDFTVTDVTGATWHANDLFVTTTIMSICTILFVAVVALLLALGRYGSRFKSPRSTR